MQIPVLFGGDGSGVNRFIYIIFGSLVGAVVGAVFVLVVDAPSNILPFGLLSGAFDGVIVGWLGWLLENAKPAVRTNNLGTKDMPLAGNPRWLVALFPVSLGALVIGLLSVLYVVSVRVAIPD
jgi:H+/Cl- antiporter ClcA